ncbi:MAG: hypothetical protein N4A74_01730 [Carboxylicivirga sp.]|jgi:hypothetical protein|nr:hypothetical protein [Carboxylicivirga sp.]
MPEKTKTLPISGKSSSGKNNSEMNVNKRGKVVSMNNYCKSYTSEFYNRIASLAKD